MEGDRCIHDMLVEQCAVCSGSFVPPVGRGSADDDHRGRPTDDEIARADRLRPQLVEALGVLAAAGVVDPMRFFVDLCEMAATTAGLESWTARTGTYWTIRNIVRGGAARHFTMNVIETAITMVNDLAS